MITQSEVDAQIVLGNIAAAAANLVNLTLVAGPNLDSGADPIAIGFDADRLNFDPMVPVSTVVSQQVRWPVHVIDDDIDVAVVVVIGEGHAAAGARGLDSGPRRVRDILKSPSASRSFNVAV